MRPKSKKQLERTELVKLKAAGDLALNLTELAIYSGWRREELARMALPLIAGKLAPTDFRRILRKRQDRIEALSIKPIAAPVMGDKPSSAMRSEPDAGAVAARMFAPRQAPGRRMTG